MKVLKGTIGFFICGVLSLILACAGAKIRPTAEGVNLMSGMEVSEGNNATTILLKGSKPARFNPFKMTDPLRIVIDIANTDVTQLKSSTSVKNGSINDIKTTQMGEETGFIGRIEIGLEKSFKYTASAEGNNIKVVISKSEAAPELTPSPIEGGAVAPPVTVPVPSGAGMAATEEVLPPPGEEIGAEVPPVGEELPPVAEAGPLEGALPPAGGEIVAEAPPPGEELPPVEGEALPPEAAAPPPVEALPPVAAPAPSAEAPMTEEAAPPPTTEVPPTVEEKAPAPVVAMVPPPPPAESPKAKIRLEKGKIKLPKSIVFESSVAQTTPEGESLLRELAAFLKENPNLKVRIDGFSDTIGPTEINQALSEYRAIWAKLLLMSMGIPDGRIQVRGFGPSKPIASNKTEAGRSKNRRIEFTVITQ